jgi:hypothetical protein
VLIYILVGEEMSGVSHQRLCFSDTQFDLSVLIQQGGNGIAQVFKAFVKCILEPYGRIRSLWLPLGILGRKLPLILIRRCLTLGAFLVQILKSGCLG